jgi:hypothetical protein
MKRKGYRRKRSWSNVRSSWHLPGGSKENHEDPNEGGRSSGRNLNPARPGVLTTESRLSAHVRVFVCDWVCWYVYMHVCVHVNCLYHTLMESKCQWCVLSQTLKLSLNYRHSFGLVKPQNATTFLHLRHHLWYCNHSPSSAFQYASIKKFKFCSSCPKLSLEFRSLGYWVWR